MSIPLDDLSPDTLDLLADLIEQRLADPDAVLMPETWQEAVQRDEIVRALTEVLHAAGHVWTAAATRPISAPSIALH